MIQTIKKFGIYALAVAAPLLLILIYEGLVWSGNRDAQGQQEQKANRQQALDQPEVLKIEKQQARLRNEQLQAARQRALKMELQQLQQIMDEQQENSKLRCVIDDVSERCQCFGPGNEAVAVMQQRCLALIGE